MDEILLCLCLKHYGEWMAIYDSLQKREELKVKEIQDAIKEVDCTFITLLDKDYSNNLKKIYKPPFGIFCYGQTKLLNENMVSIYADINDVNTWQYIDYLQNNKKCLTGLFLINLCSKIIFSSILSLPRECFCKELQPRSRTKIWLRLPLSL